jgi:hypothetical protein
LEFPTKNGGIAGDARPDLVHWWMMKAGSTLFFEGFSRVASLALPGGGAASLPIKLLRSPDPNEDLFENQSAWI